MKTLRRMETPVRQLGLEKFTKLTEKKLKLHVESNVRVILCGMKNRPHTWSPRESDFDISKSLVDESSFQPKGDLGCFNNCTANAQWVQICTKEREVVGYSLMSPLSPTTLPVQSRRALSFPENAHEYAFLYRAEEPNWREDRVSHRREKLLLTNASTANRTLRINFSLI